MKFDFNIPYIPSKKQIKDAATVAACAAGVVILIKLVSGIVKKVHEKNQDKSIKKLTNQVNDLQARLDKLEKNNA